MSGGEGGSDGEGRIKEREEGKEREGEGRRKERRGRVGVDEGWRVKERRWG